MVVSLDPFPYTRSHKHACICVLVTVYVYIYSGMEYNASEVLFTCVQMSKPLKFLLWSSLALLLLQIGSGLKCESKNSEPTVKQTQVKWRQGIKFRVEVMNKCPMCPVINLRLKCQGFPQSLVDPTLLRVLSSSTGNCVVNDGLPLSPMQTLSFNYSNSHQFALRPLSWSFQCE